MTDNTENKLSSSAPGVQPDRVDLNDHAATAKWAKKLDVTDQQLKDAVKEVGDKAADVEMHLKGSHSTTNADRVNELKGR
ncbi:MAG: DUF3606 domain-containing protein [Comamonadaceae bacterium]|nr:MAG: DUF3606 domain-containing protein [Comamonadaceae bacterium]